MKYLIAIILLALISSSCKKNYTVPGEYLGTWKAETPEFLQTNNRIHTLVIPNQGKGTYTSVGAYKIGDDSNKGYIKIENNSLSVGGKEFEIIEPPYQDSIEDEILSKMQLGNLEFEKQ